MKIPDISDENMGRCCADFYNHPLVLQLLDGVFHPGGLALSNLMAEKMGLRPQCQVIDIACGDGMTATFLAKKWKCHVTGIDAGEEMIQKARARAKDIGVSYSTAFQVGFAMNMPFSDASYDAAYSECAVCTFTDKNKSVDETYRILKTGGTLGINDIVLHDYSLLNDELKGLIGQVACVAGALPPQGYIDLFESRGFTKIWSSDHSDLLAQMVEKAAGKARILTGLEDSLSGSATPEDVLRIINKIREQVQSGNLGYQMFVFKKND